MRSLCTQMVGDFSQRRPFQLLPAAVAVRLVFPLKGHMAAWTYPIGVVILVNNGFSNLFRRLLGDAGINFTFAGGEPIAHGGVQFGPFAGRQRLLNFYDIVSFERYTANIAYAQKVVDRDVKEL